MKVDEANTKDTKHTKTQTGMTMGETENTETKTDEILRLLIPEGLFVYLVYFVVTPPSCQ
jgi:hypothetical protein